MNSYKEISSRTLRVAVALLILILTTGTVGFMFIEDEYSLIDAFYMTIVTVSTVGFREVHPLSDAGKIFTSGLILFSLGGLAYVGSTLASYVLDGEFINYLKTYRVYKKVDKLKDHVIVCGFGRNGEQVCDELTDHNTPFVIIEKRDHVIERIRQNPSLLYIRGDATHEEVLEQARVHHAKALIATTPNDADNVFVVLTARSMNPNLKIISRASEIKSDVKLRRAGATNVIMPERIGGQRMAKLVTQPDVVEFLEYILIQQSRDVTLEEIACKNMGTCFMNGTIGELRKNNPAEVSIIGLKNREGRYIINPTKEHKLDPKDQLFILGAPNEIDRFRQLLED
ncbi:potassium channel protein [Prolixibacteraceae bacterium JC049]|nr:potassium channel protein [Prolixibacteraceae bacterium JC049]